MPVENSTLGQLAQALIEASETQTPINRLTAQHDISIEEAYEIQKLVIDQRRSDGASVVGHKIGLTSEGIQKQLGVDEPDYGHLLDSMRLSEPAVRFDDLISPRVEPELGFHIGKRLKPPVTTRDVLAATEFVVPVFEVIDSRIRDWDIQIQDTIADNASSAYYWVGNRSIDTHTLDLSMEGVKLYRNGVLEKSGLSAAVLQHPARAVAWLATTLTNLNTELEPNQLVLSGSFTPALDVTAGDVVTAEFGTAGSVRLRID